MTKHFSASTRRFLLLALTLLSACGGGSPADSQIVATSGVPATEMAPASEGRQKPRTDDDAQAREAARLNQTELQNAALHSVGLTKAQTKALASIPVYRFFNTLTNAHFYTASVTERDHVRATLPYLQYEGEAFQASAQGATGLSPVYRFYNQQTGVHFYTISGDERAFVQANYPQFIYEGVAYYASKVLGAGFRGLYRFYYFSKGFHFYSVDPNEAATLPQYRAEGLAYYVIGEAPSPGAGLLYGDMSRAAVGSGAALNGSVPFPPDNAWNLNVSSLPVDPNSANLIASIGLATGLHADFGAGLYNGQPIGIPYVVVDGNQPLVPMNFTDYADESEPGPYPVPPGAPIEGGPNSSGDRHVLVIDKQNNRLYELGNAYPQNTGASWNASGGAVFHLNSNTVRPGGQPGWTSADAAGLPIFPGLARYDEAAKGPGGIPHALRFTVQRTRKAYVPPATHWASGNTDPNLPPMGMRVRLKASFVIPSNFSVESRALLTAMKTHGMLVADNGSAWYVSGAPDARWNNDTLSSELRQVHGSDFEVVKMDGLVTP